MFQLYVKQELHLTRISHTLRLLKVTALTLHQDKLKCIFILSMLLMLPGVLAPGFAKFVLEHINSNHVKSKFVVKSLDVQLHIQNILARICDRQTPILDNFFSGFLLTFLANTWIVVNNRPRPKVFPFNHLQLFYSSTLFSHVV